MKAILKRLNITLYELRVLTCVVVICFCALKCESRAESGSTTLARNVLVAIDKSEFKKVNLYSWVLISSNDFFAGIHRNANKNGTYLTRGGVKISEFPEEVEVRVVTVVRDLTTQPKTPVRKEIAEMLERPQVSVFLVTESQKTPVNIRQVNCKMPNHLDSGERWEYEFVLKTKSLPIDSNFELEFSSGQMGVFQKIRLKI